MTSPRFLLTLGLILLLVGCVIPFLTIMQVFPSTFFLNFLAWSATTSGMVLGFIGSAMWVKLNKQ